ncbi:uncharacterized oxidoreductase TM_0325-like [Aplysia californica]|uniref:Uncharacterized oxidoreductase TM_0325-like n=1 Tax=Aplysia californica TaxID=6500 RepID=A0ABM1VW44_APLCA|nr:uncharacterized oxidoreductase TM_0325-like [Aplysia californica]
MSEGWPETGPGSSSGLGQATAVLFAQRSCSVVLSGTNEKRLQETLEKCQKAGLKRDQILTVAGDITTHKTREEIVTRTFGKFKRIDILVNNAGALYTGFIKDLEEKDIDTTFNLNFKVPVLLSKLVFPYLKETKGTVCPMERSLSLRPFCL